VGPCRNLAALAVLIAMLSPPQSVLALERTPTGPELILSYSQVDLGSATPDDPANVPRIVLAVTVIDDLPWTLQLLARDLVSPEGTAHWPADHLLWRLRGDRFRPMSPGLPIVLSAGAPTGSAPTTLYFEFSLQSDWSIAPARYEGTLSFLLSATVAAPAGTPSSLRVDAPIRFLILPFASLRVLDSAPDSPVVDPSRSDWFAYPPLRVTIRSNTNWALFAEPLDDFRHQTASAHLPAGILAVDEATAAGRQTLARQVASLVASGGPTGNVDAEVVLRLKVRMEGGEPAGQYRMPVRLRLTPASGH
jgi:hypothetical protein